MVKRRLSDLSNSSDDAEGSPDPDYAHVNPYDGNNSDVEMGDVDSEDEDDQSDSDASSSNGFSPKNPKDSSRSLPWHENMPLLTHVGLKKLDDNGYINLETICVDDNFGYSVQRAMPGAWYRQNLEDRRLAGSTPPKKKQRALLGDEHHIHPIFNKNKWAAGSISDKDWDTLSSVWHLATLLLEEETMVGYWLGLIDMTEHNRIRNSEAEAMGLRPQYWFESKVDPSDQDKQRFWAMLTKLADCVTWIVSPDPDLDSHAETTKIPGTSTAMTKGGVKSKITIHSRYIGILCGRISVSSSAKDTEQWAGTDEDSGRLRLVWNVAATMVHELTHAMWNAIMGYADIEPFYRDTRIAELGWQWEREFFSGTIQPHTLEIAAPYGLKIERWPGAEYDKQSQEPALMSHKKWGRGPNWRTEYALEMGWVQGFFTNDFWDEVDRFGLQALRPLRLLGARADLKGQEGQFHDDESPTIHQFDIGPRSPPSPDDGGRGIRVIERSPFQRL